MLLNSQHHRWVYLFSLALIALGLPFSKAFISIGEIILAINFLAEGQFRERFQSISKNRTALLFVLFFLIHVVALLWTSDYGYALKDLRVKLPLLLFPLVIPLTPRLTRKEFHLIIGLFIVSVLSTSILSTFEYIKVMDNVAADFREISLFTSHIRYSLMVCFAYLFLLNAAWHETKNVLSRFTYIGLAIWMSIFIFILQSMTGIVIWLLCSYLLLGYTIFYINRPVLRTVGMTAIILTPLLIGLYVSLQVDAYYPDEKPDFTTLEHASPSGEVYFHDTNNLILENGHFIHFYIANGELAQEWNKRSDIPFEEGKDEKGQFVKTTLIRYLTSKGLRKDSAGVKALTNTDIEVIESGVANVRFTFGNPIDNRIYTVIWEFERLLHEQHVQGHSVTQRILFWKTGWQIFKDNWLIGVGTGDVMMAYNQMYDQLTANLPDKYRLRAHNQYLSIGISFGLIGLLIFLLSAIYPFFSAPTANSFLFIGFTIILYISMLNEDTLETQTGVTIYAFFNALLLFGVSNDYIEDRTAS